MAETDVAMKVWLKNKERFADFFNGIVFDGEQVIKSEELEDVDSEADIIVTDKAENTRPLQRHRDIVMRWNGELSLAILAIENQTDINHEMPVRVMLYDALAYDQQIKNRVKTFGKYDTLYPVISIVFYYGSSPWDSNKDLYDMFKVISGHKLRDKLLRYTPNYKINLVEVVDFEAAEKFRTDLHMALGMLKCGENQYKMAEYINENSVFFKSVKKDTIDAITAMLRIDKIKEYIPNLKEGESGDMCKAFNDMMDSAKEEGRAEREIIVVKNMLSRGFSVADICAIAECTEDFVRNVENSMV